MRCATEEMFRNNFLGPGTESSFAENSKLICYEKASVKQYKKFTYNHH